MSDETDQQEQIQRILLHKGEELVKKPRVVGGWTGSADADSFLDDLERTPHAFVLGCVMDRQIKAERAWRIPYEVSKELGGFDFLRLLRLTESQTVSLFKTKSLHRFNETMGVYFYRAIQRIHSSYGDNAGEIWSGTPSSATVVKRFLEFDGIGEKIATMAANILARDFKVPMSDYFSIDISLDTHVKRVFRRTGLVPRNAKDVHLIYRAREMNPHRPGIFDLSCWEIGRTWCKPKNPKCQDCYLNDYCAKVI